MPKLSIITVNLNNAPGLQKTMQSVFAQTFSDYDYIIIDGDSTDSSKEFIEKHADKLSYWVSETDEGIYQAMNKGIAKANGEYLLFLNSGDYFYSDESLSALFKNSNYEDIIYGNLLVNEEDGKQWILDYPAELSFGYFYRHSLPHQSTLIKTNLFKTIGSNSCLCMIYWLEFSYCWARRSYRAAADDGHRLTPRIVAGPGSDHPAVRQRVGP